jgi:putative ABC transport system permease protein
MPWQWWFRRTRWDDERALEMQAHLDLQIDEYIADGMTPDVARREALRRFGNRRAIREEIYDMNSAPLVEAIMRDARYALRIMRKTPIFTTTAVVTLGFAIAINTAVFSVVDAVLLKPLPYPHPDRLAAVKSTTTGVGATREAFSQTGFTWEALRDHATTLDPAVYSGWTTGVNLVAGGRPSFVQQQRVGAGFFAVLGARPIVGREFTPAEDRAGGPPAAILSYGLWQSMFGGDLSVVGRPIMLRGESSTIVGVMPQGFRTSERADLWTPLKPSTTGEGENDNYGILARIHDGVPWTEAEAEVQAIGANLARSRPQRDGASIAYSLEPLQRGLTEGLRQPILLLWSAVAIVMLVASVNLAGLLLARASVRTRELATRMALGSGRAAVVRQLLVESVVLAIAGGTLGILAGFGVLAGLRAVSEQAFEFWQPVSLDARAIAAGAALALLASIVFGLAPALHATRVDVQAALVETGGRGVAGRSARWPRRALVVAQVALGVILLVGAGLLVRTFTHLRHLDPGFDGAGVITVMVSLQDARYATGARVTRLFDDVLGRVAQSPGVESAGVALGLPYERLLNMGFRFLDGPQASSPGRNSSMTYVSGDFFRALRIPIRAGRTFDARDRTDSAGVVVVSETFARQYFPGDNAMGRHIQLAGRPREIVGIAGDVQVRPGWGNNGPIAAMPLSYIPATQASDGTLRLIHVWFSPSFIVRSSLPPEAAVAAVRQAIDASEPLLPLAGVRRMRDVQTASLAVQRLMMTLLVSLAVAAVLLAALGIHGLIATSVAERTREVGIRMALGASWSDAIRTLAIPGIILSLAGTALGATGALASARLLRHYLWGVSPTDPVTFGGVAVILVAIASLASVLPAMRILKLDPASTLRQE